MNKITYHYSALSKQAWFYAGVLYLMLSSIVSFLVEIYKVEGYYETQNLPLVMVANAVGMIVFILLSFGHYVCYSEYDDEKIIYKNIILRTAKTFYYKDAKSVIFDKRGIKFYANEQDLIDKKKPLFYIPFFRDGKVEAIPVNNFFIKMQAREKEINNHEEFSVYKVFKVLPGYGRKWKYLAFAYACLTLLVVMNCAKPLAVIIGLVETFG